MERQRNRLQIIALLLAIWPFVFAQESNGTLAQEVQGADIYVDAENTEGPWDGSPAYPYATIKKAVNTANGGDSIYVQPGVYSPTENSLVIFPRHPILSPNNLRIESVDWKNKGDNQPAIIEGAQVLILTMGVTLIGFNISAGSGARLPTAIRCALESVYTPDFFPSQILNCSISNYHTGIAIIQDYDILSQYYNDMFHYFVRTAGYKVVISNCFISNCHTGILYDRPDLSRILEYYWEGLTRGIDVTHNTITNNYCAIHVSGDYATLQHNIIANNTVGIRLSGFNRYCAIQRNLISNNTQYGALVGGIGCHNLFSVNDFIDNGINARDEATSAFSRPSYSWIGNYWSDYNGLDSDLDGIGDTPYNISGGGEKKDHKPVMNPHPNTRPNAHAGSDQIVERGVPMFLYGLHSRDPEGDLLSFHWTIISKPNGSQTILDNPASPTPTIICDLVGEYIVNLTVNDGHLDSAPDSVKLVANDTKTPIITITSPLNLSYSSDSVKLAFSLSETVPVSLVLDGSNKGVLTNGTVLSNLSEGTHNLTLCAEDPVGNFTNTTVWFSIDTRAPTVTVLSPREGSYSSDLIPLNYTVSENATVTVYLDNVSQGFLPGNSLFSGLSEGLHNLTVRAVDEAGNERTVAIWFVIDTIAPTVTIVSPASIPYPTNSITLSHGVSENATVTVYLDNVNQGSVPSNSLLSGLSEGLHNLTVYAVDDAGNEGSAMVWFTTPAETEDSPGFQYVMLIITVSIFVVLSKKKGHGLKDGG